MGFVAHGQQYTSVPNPATSTAAPFDQLLGVNNHGVAVGFYNDADGAAHGCTYDTRSGSFVPVLLPVPADSVVAAGIADDGDVSGFYTVDKVTTGFVFRHGTFRKLSFGAGTNTQALGVNNWIRSSVRTSTRRERCTGSCGLRVHHSSTIRTDRAARW